MLGTILVCIGALLIGIFGAIGEPAHTLDQLLVLLGRHAFILWMAGTFLIVLVTLVGARVLKHLSRSPRYQFPYAGSLHVPRLKILRGVAFGFISGILSAHCLLLAKSAVELIVRTVVDHVNQFNRWQSWVIVIAMICLALTQLYYLHRGLKVCSTSVLYPFVFCVYNIVAILDGLIYFHQASRLTGVHAGLIAVGTVILLSGVLCLSWRLEEAPTAPPVAPTQPLAPGMGLIDDTASPRSSGLLYPTDEEAGPGERQPLLRTPQQRKYSAHQRTPSLPLVSPYHQSTTTTPGVEAAEIWAELDDDDDDKNEADQQNGMDSRSSLQPPTTPPPHFLRSQKRYRSKSSTLSTIVSSNGPRRRSLEIEDGRSISPLAWKGGSTTGKGRAFDPRLLRSTGLGISRRTSAPVVVGPTSRQRRRTRHDVPVSNGRTSLDSIGQEEASRDDDERIDINDLEDGATRPGTASSRRRRSRPRSSTGAGGWRSGLGWLRRLTRGNRTRDGEDGGNDNTDRA